MKNMVSPEGNLLASVATTQLTQLIDNTDYEGAHGRADDILCELLSALGYEHTVVAAFIRIGKWYA